uniref:Band 7 domain-containing protein n=1 Tax=Aegilops tauschii subsp. strangulata TaxID=200361 RepID=A0A453GHN3_AEGTS
MVSAFFLFRGCVEQANVERGRFLRLAEPGIYFFNPSAGELVAGTLSTRVQSLETKTKVLFLDNVFVQLICTIKYRVVKENADDAFYKLQNPRTANSVLRL